MDRNYNDLTSRPKPGMGRHHGDWRGIIPKWPQVFLVSEMSKITQKRKMMALLDDEFI